MSQRKCEHRCFFLPNFPVPNFYFVFGNLFQIVGCKFFLVYKHTGIMYALFLSSSKTESPKAAKADKQGYEQVPMPSKSL